MTKPWAVLHLELDGLVRGRDDENGYPEVHFELHPIGTELEEDQQRHELVIVIDEGGHFEMSTRLDTRALAELIDFLSSAKVPKEVT